ncbi:MAG: type II toxin-antitoxin system prevent-host-death family antitoxin [Ignavibacteriota bacterium]
MITVPISEFRSKIPFFIKKIEHGVKVALTSHGKVVAELTPPTGLNNDMQKRLEYLRSHSKVGDVLSPSGEWEAQG